MVASKSTFSRVLPSTLVSADVHSQNARNSVRRDALRRVIPAVPPSSPQRHPPHYPPAADADTVSAQAELAQAAREPRDRDLRHRQRARHEHPLAREPDRSRRAMERDPGASLSPLTQPRASGFILCIAHADSVCRATVVGSGGTPGEQYQGRGGDRYGRAERPREPVGVRAQDGSVTAAMSGARSEAVARRGSCGAGRGISSWTLYYAMAGLTCLSYSWSVILYQSGRGSHAVDGRL